MPTTEIASFPLKAGIRIGDPDDASAGVFKDIFATLMRQDGMQQVHFGPGVEDPTMLHLFVNWDDKSKHDAFMASSEYGPFMENFGKLATGGAQMHHVDFSPAGALNKVLAAPVTEVANFYFDGDVPAEYGEGVSKAAEVFQKNADGFKGLAWGPTYEVLEHNGVKGKASVLVIGWTDVQAHTDYRGSQSFKDNRHLLWGTAKEAKVTHFQAMPFLE